MTKRARYDEFPSNMTQLSQNYTQGNAGSVSKGNTKRKVRSDKGNKRGLAKYIKTVIQNQAEKKEILTNLTATLNATQTSVLPLNIMGQGTTAITRVGLEVKHSYIEITIGANNVSQGNGPYNGDYGFWAIVLDRQPNGALATFASIFDDSLALGSAGTDFRITTTNQDRFKIISRNEWSIGCGTALVGAVAFVTGAPPYHIKEYIDLSKLQGNDKSTNYSSSGTTIAAIDAGALLFVWASSTTDADNFTLLTGQAKYRFTDM